MRERLHSRLSESLRKIIRDNVEYTVRAYENPCDYGNWYIQAVNHKGFEGYLYPDLSIRTRPAFTAANHGYFLTWEEAEATINRFENKRKPMSQTKAASDSKLRSIIEKALQEFIDAKEMFTAFDVTVKVRNEQATNGIHVFHNVVKEFVHDEFTNGIAMMANGYDRTLVQIGNPPPWLYYIPGTHNPGDYKATPTNVTSIQATPAATNVPKAQAVKRAPAVATFGGFTGEAAGM